MMISIEKAKTLLKSSVMQTHYKVPSQLQVNCIKYQNNYHAIFINEHKHVISTLKTYTDLNEYLSDSTFLRKKHKLKRNMGRN